MAERNFSVGTQEFQLNKIDTFKQFHIARRIAPILGDMLPAMKDLAASKKGIDDLPEDQKFDQLAKMADPILKGLAKLNDEDANKVLLGLLSSIEVKQQSGNWSKVATESRIMFEDIDLPTLLNAAGRAFMFNLSGFFDMLPRVSHGPK